MSNKEPILMCPHCSGVIIIKKINCGASFNKIKSIMVL